MKEEFLYGYIPLLDKSILSTKQIPRDEVDITIADPKGLIWIEVNDVISPVFVVDNAKAIVSHIYDWSDGVPHEWFKIYHSSVKQRKSFAYYIGLFPDIYKTFERFKSKFNIEVAEVAFHPISIFIEDTDSYIKMREQNSKKVTVLFVDSAAIDNPEDIKLDSIDDMLYYLKDIEVVDSIQEEGKWDYCKQYCKNYFISNE